MAKRKTKRKRKKKDNSYKLIFRFLKFLKPYKLKGFFVGLGMTIDVLLDIPLPLLTMYLIDEVLVNKQLDLLYWISGALIVLIIVQSAIGLATNYGLVRLEQRIFVNIKMRLLMHIERLSMAFFNRYSSGYIFARVTDDIAASRSLLFDTIASVFLSIIQFAIGLVILLKLHVPLTMVSLVVLPFFILSLKLYNKQIRKLSEQNQEREAQATSGLQELLSGMRLIKSFVREKLRLNVYKRTYNRLIRKRLELTRVELVSGFIIDFVASVGPILVLIYGGSEVVKGNLTIGELVAFSAFLGYLYGPIEVLMDINTEIQASIGPVKRIFEIFDTPQEIKDTKKECPEFKNGKIEFKNVYFAYKDNKYVLKDIDLIIPARTSCALVGPSGSGKTTLAELISRFYDPQKGQILIDNNNTQEISVSCIRKQVAEVTQNTFIFKGTIKDNIKFGKLDATDQEVIEAAKMAHAHDFVSLLPKKYETEIGEKGVGLSGGQLQRIALARAIVKHHNILILDEATSALDVESDVLIQKALREIMKFTTTVIVAHRLSTIHHVDQIVVLDKGKIIQVGKHKELYKDKKGLYRKLHDLIEKESQEIQVKIPY